MFYDVIQLDDVNLCFVVDSITPRMGPVEDVMVTISQIAILTVAMLIHCIEMLVMVKYNNIPSIHIAFHFLFFHKFLLTANKDGRNWVILSFWETTSFIRNLWHNFIQKKKKLKRNTHGHWTCAIISVWPAACTDFECVRKCLYSHSSPGYSGYDSRERERAWGYKNQDGGEKFVKKVACFAFDAAESMDATLIPWHKKMYFNVNPIEHEQS